MFYNISVDRYDYVVNGEALKALILKSTKTCSESYIILFLRFLILPTLSLGSYRMFFNISVDRYDYVVNGEALKEIHEYMEVEHTFAEYTEVSDYHIKP